MAAAEERTTISAERVALNDATFRNANEEIRAHADEYGVEGLLPTLCECADIACTTVLRLTREEYEAVRADPVRFVNAHGHDAGAGGWVEVVEEHERYVVVKKLGHAAEIAARLDPRAQA